jgi:hypothetical protein
MKVRKIYFSKKGVCSIICHHCGNINSIDTNSVNLKKPLEIKCKCQKNIFVQLEQREYYRKAVKLTGIFEKISPGNTQKGKVIIEDISYTGLGCRTLTKHYIETNDVLQLNFALDDAHNSQITEKGIVRDIRDRYLGIEFQELSQHNRKLIGFYLMPMFATPEEHTPKKEIEPPDTSDYSPDHMAENPFRFSTLPAEADLKGKLGSLGLSGILQVLSWEHKSGVLHFIRGETGRAICLKDGKIIAATGGEWLRLGQILHNKRLISWENLAEALGRAGESNKRLGEVLLDLEFISNDILKDSIRYQVQQTVSDLASWGEGEFEYRDCSVEFEDRSIEKIDITGLILEATRRVDESKSTFTEVSTVKKAREYARAKVAWPLSILTVQGPLEGEVRDISLTGALIHCYELPDPDSPIPMAIEIPEQHYSIFATGEMIRLDIEDEEREHPSFLLGIRFAEISEDDLSFLSQKVLH